MRSFLTFLTSLLVLPGCQAQVKQGFELETYGGYEYNYFKSPEVVEQQGQLLGPEELISSSIYQDIALDYDYRYKRNGHRIRLSAAPYARLFQESMEDSYWSLNLTAKYDHDLGKSTQLLAGLSFKRMDRDGLDGAQDVLINPLGYTKFGLSGGLGFSPFAGNEMEIEGFYNFKDFDAFGVRDLQFDEFGITLNTKQVLGTGRLQQAIGLRLSLKKRLYETFNASDIISEGVREWNYAKAFAYYEYPLSESLELKPGFVYYLREDYLEDRSGFNQYGPSLGLTFDDDKTRIRASLKYLTRDYTTLEARNNEGATGGNIQYTYTDISVHMAHQIGSSPFYLTANLYSRVRATNYTDVSARSFRGYRNQYGGIGLRWKI